MIPTSFSGSSPPTAVVGGSFLNLLNNSPLTPGSSTSHSGSSSSSNNVTSNSPGGLQGPNSALLGIASLILEGRALAEDEYAVAKHQDVISVGQANIVECGRQSPKPSTSRAAATFHDYQMAGATGGGGANNSSDIAGYLRRKASNSPESSSQSPSSLLRDYYNSNSSSESASSSVESNHSRWTQKLSQLRQESPNAGGRERKVAVECMRSVEPEYVALAINTDQTLDERRSAGGTGDFEIIRRIALNRINLYNSPISSSGAGNGGGGGGSGGGSIDNFMCSLQSLASNTCLRVGTPIHSNPLSASTPRYANYRVMHQNTPRFPTPQHTDVSSNSSSSGCSLQSPMVATATAWHQTSAGTPLSTNTKEYLLRKPSTERIAIPTPQTTPTNSASTSCNSTYYSYGFSSRREGSMSGTTMTPTATTASTATTTTTTTPMTSRNSNPQQGPHCDQFLRKMGLAKGDASETEEHHCDMSYVNITCTRWRAYCIKMENILARGEPICIEVYLGPVGHKILLEQWIISVNEKQPPPTMTLPSLCSAIRSQLYFSQISAWCDLIKKSDKTIYDTGRLIFTTPPTLSAAGDLATTTPASAGNLLSTSPTMIAMTIDLPSANNTSNINSPVGGGVGVITSSPSPSTSSGGGGGGGGGVGGNNCSASRKPPRLNIFYRIKPYDDNGTASCFNSKPNIHNFPNVNISENCSLSVCLKSLPRITGGIPKVVATTVVSNSSDTATAAANSPPSPNTPKTSEIKTGMAAAASSSSMTRTTAALATTTMVATNKPTTKTLTKICDNSNSKEHQQQQQQTTVPKLNLGNSHFSSDDRNRNENRSNARQNDNSNNEGNILALGAVGDSGCNNDGVSGIAGGIDGDSSNSSASTFYGNLSHREKQILKYRKRMLKRDKKHQQQQQQRKANETNTSQSISDNFSVCGGDGGEGGVNDNGGSLQMDQGEDYEDDDLEANYGNTGNGQNAMEHRVKVVVESQYVNNTTTLATKGQRQPNSFINIIPYTNGQTPALGKTSESNQQQHVKMISTGTQTITSSNSNSNSNRNTNTTCSSCGYEKSMICLKCNPLKVAPISSSSISTTPPHSSDANNIVDNYNDDCHDNNDDNDDDGMDAESVITSRSPSSSSSVSSLSSSDIIHTPRNKAELLLQAIQRTPKSNKKLKITKDLQNPQQHQQQQQPSHHTNKAKSNKTPAAATALAPAHSRPTTTNSSNNNNGHHNRAMPSNNSISSSSSSSSSSSPSGVSIMQLQSCQLCKRQKTQHNFQQVVPFASSLEVATGDGCPALGNSAVAACSSPLIACSQSNGNKSDDVLGGGESENDLDGGKMSTNEDCVDKGLMVLTAKPKSHSNVTAMANTYKDQEVMEQEYFVSSTKLTPNIERCSLGSKTYYSQPSPSSNGTDTQRLCSTPPLEEHNTENAKGQGGLVMAQFKTPTPSQQHDKLNIQRQVQQQPHKQTPKPNLLAIAFSFNGGEMSANQSSINSRKPNEANIIPSIHNPLLARRNSPKVNLTRIFCNPTSMKASSPIPIGHGSNIMDTSSSSTPSTASISSAGSKSADINVADVAPTFSFESPSGQAPTITVQKSNSAPTLPNSPSLSPRFIKASALYKRRSRHLSDRSDRSSLGSDEQFSDEDIDCGMYSPFATSPVKLRTRLSAVFGRKPLLGNLEESLLQRRLVPKIEVMGFKLLLGASGGFCPTQLTIPAAAYFYELKGETLSTPYLCEIRLPRKGYSVPRCGTVQATLLNPMGTVVRMFVIPYDMRDMPALHQTFVRQRILADSGNGSGSTSVQQTTSTRPISDNLPDGLVGDNCAVVGDTECCDAMVQNGNNDFHNSPGRLGHAASGDNATINNNNKMHQNSMPTNGNYNNNNSSGAGVGNIDNNLGHFISAENMKSLRYSIHLRFQTSRSGRLMLHTDIRLLISRRTDCDTAAAHAKGVLEAPNELITKTVMPTNPKYSARQDQTTSSKI
ncbi:atos homolog atossa [Haematobia irritans]|uniref:atos homolog atossa n=1 Tax=Haematobia irritans TaxID=7368 RepID=UPI003F50142A